MLELAPEKNICLSIVIVKDADTGNIKSKIKSGYTALIHISGFRIKFRKRLQEPIFRHPRHGGFRKSPADANFMANSLPEIKMGAT
ncbi:MAG TPA: hypothetical protein DCY53_04565 [Desulfobacteraceae bacterium]|nr:hypothetical protein [Desulfobacteraceae bacterium]